MKPKFLVNIPLPNKDESVLVMKDGRYILTSGDVRNLDSAKLKKWMKVIGDGRFLTTPDKIL